MNGTEPKKPRKKYTFKDRLALLDKRIERHTKEAVRLKDKRALLVREHRARAEAVLHECETVGGDGTSTPE